MMKEVKRGNPSPDSDNSDDDDDEETLIPQNDTKPASDSPHFSALHLGDDLDFHSSTRRHRRQFCSGNLKDKKKYIFMILIPLVVVLVYFSVDFGRLFGSGIWNVKFAGGSVLDRMRESELRSLYLLRQQRFEFVSLLRRFPEKDVNSTIDGFVLKGLREEIYKQIDVNKEIEQVLLSAHRDGNVNVTGSGVADGGLGDLGMGMCGKVDQKSDGRRTIEWKPREDRFLFAICASGQMSNHLICLEKHMFFAAVLNRVLVIPSPKVDYQFNRVLDVDHINECLGRKVVLTFDEFYERKKKYFRINKFICYFSAPEHCFLDGDHVKKLKELGLSIPKLESPWQEDVKKPSKRTVQDIEAKFSSDEEVIVVGDVYFADVENEWVAQPGGPIAHKCKTLIEPSHLIILTAQRFVQTFLGRDFVALHFRRYGFLKFCNAKEPSCFFPIPQAADCIRRLVERANTPVIYLASDAAESETGLLQSLIVVDGKPVPLVSRPTHSSAEKWDALLYRHGLGGDPQVDAMLDKTICAMSSVFIGSSGSTFTEDILRLRKDWGSASTCDEYICQGELPNFIAETE